MLRSAGSARHSIALRLALMFAAAAVIGLALLGAGLYQVLRYEFSRHQQEELRDRVEDVGYMLVHDPSPQLAQAVHQKIEAILSDDPYVRFWIWSVDPAYRYGEGAEQIARQFGQPGPHGQMRRLAASSPGERSIMALGVALPANDVRPALVLVAGNENPSFTSTLHTFELSLALFTLIGAALVAALGYWIARVGLRPLAHMSADAQAIGSDSRSRRLALPPLPRELLDLGQSFNAALDRLERAYRQLETFNADVAHELRTPLTNMIGQTQVTLARDREASVLREVLQSNLEELERLRVIVADMLFLARAEQGERAPGQVETPIAAEVGKTIEFFEVLLDEARLRVTVHGDALAPIETTLFRRALTNLLQNAIQHTPPGGGIQVHITSDADSATVAFSNPSGSITPEQLARLFDRFYRIDAARSNSDENHGLGLAIVKAVAAMHGGQVFARMQDGVITVGFSVALQHSGTAKQAALPC